MTDRDIRGPDIDGRAACLRKALLWLPPLVYIFLILLMAARPAPQLPQIVHVDKYLHGIAYALLAVLAFRSSKKSGLRYPTAATLLIAGAAGIADEIIQSFTAARTASIDDFMADTVGAIIGSLVAKKIMTTRPE